MLPRQYRLIRCQLERKIIVFLLCRYGQRKNNKCQNGDKKSNSYIMGTVHKP